MAAPLPVTATASPTARLINLTTAEVSLPSGLTLTIDFYGDNIFRLFADPKGGIVRNPIATPPADILVSTPRRPLSGVISVSNANGNAIVASPDVTVTVDSAGMITVTDKDGNLLIEQTEPTAFNDDSFTLGLKEKDGEWFYGGGVQNGRFSHRGRAIEIVNQNSWTDGGVCSPAPFFWSTGGYGIMFHTFEPGRYDFGAEKPGTVVLTHSAPYLDMFVMASPTPTGLLNDFYQLTGNPVLLPKFGFYQGHLNAYNRDYWTPDTTGRGVLFEDGIRYRESQKDNGGIRESLNGELPGNYQFSARAVVDRYANADMPLGWVLPNDGYGAGYGQTGSLEGNVENLKQFGDYARSKGVEIGLWTQSDLHPKEGVEPLLQRDIVREVRDAGVRVLKTDVAWVGYGYSFGLNGVADVGEIMPYYGNDARPFIISLDGWAGTQRYAGIWSGDQTGGEWEYIRFHIPTYIGSGLAGNPNITSDMDGIFGGKKPVINTRDFQWKTWTPMQLNMDGWGANEKYPQAMGEPYTSINRHYLKLKSQLMPYAYTYAREAVDGKPLIRAMFLDYPNTYTYSPATRYQYLYGPDFLIAPIYQATASDDQGNDIRNGIYLPEGIWIDYFNGDAYHGGRVINSFPAPVWKLPVFVRQGAIIPMVNPNNNPSEINKSLRIYELYPAPGTSEMTEYDDDGTTEAYLRGQSATTHISMTLSDKDVLSIDVAPTQGSFEGMQPMKSTELIINATSMPKSVESTIGSKVKLTRVSTLEEFNRGGENIWYYNPAPELNTFATPGSEFASVKITKNPQILVRLATTNTAENGIRVTVKGYKYDTTDKLLASHGSLSAPMAAQSVVEPYAVTPKWATVENADFYEVEFDGMNYSTIAADSLSFTDLQPETDYVFKVRAVNADGQSPWTEIAVKTLGNPLEHAIHDIRGRASSPDQEGFEAWHLFDFAESGDIYHSQYQTNALPCTITADLVAVNHLDKMEYLPRDNAGNGTILAGSVQTSINGNDWSEPVAFEWARDKAVKTFVFESHPDARYVRINVDKAVGNYVSGRELYIFRTPGSEPYYQGDINKDGKIDDNDFTSYMNYTGLRRGDSDFDYVSVGDVNANGLIDAYDISLVARELDGGLILPDSVLTAPQGSLTFAVAPRRAVNAGDEVTVTVSGKALKAINALSFALPYNALDFEYIGIKASGLNEMANLTYDRLHTSGDKVLYPTFVNRGTKPMADGSGEIITITFRAKRKAAFTLSPCDIILVGPDGQTVK
ncbi:MAG: DUF5110 domain-containing protein [Alloprevotella sp.]|nr:DUF5110 domain-containing protein [Alloprevotella sp.]